MFQHPRSRGPHHTRDTQFFTCLGGAEARSHFPIPSLVLVGHR